MDADGTLGANAAAMLGFAESLHGAAEHLQGELAELEGQVGDMLGGWRGAAGSAFASAWELWRRGAGEVQFGLSMLAESVGQAGAGYQPTRRRRRGLYVNWATADPSGWIPPRCPMR